DYSSESYSDDDRSDVSTSSYSPPRRRSRRSDRTPTMAQVDPLTQQLPLLHLFGNTISAYDTILKTRGSLAVGIGGYKPVARELLERVDALFDRELSLEASTWGEALEWIGGNRKLPELPDAPLDEAELL